MQVSEYPPSHERIVDALYEQRLGLFTDAELDLLGGDLAAISALTRDLEGGDLPLRGLLRDEIRWAAANRRDATMWRREC